MLYIYYSLTQETLTMPDCWHWIATDVCELRIANNSTTYKGFIYLEYYYTVLPLLMMVALAPKIRKIYIYISDCDVYILTWRYE